MRIFKYILLLVVVCLSVRAAKSNKSMVNINIGSININGACSAAKRASVFKLFQLKNLDVV